MPASDFRGTSTTARWDNASSKIATRTGDDGTTGLGDGTRVPKDHLRVMAMGDVDELNSGLGGELSMPGHELLKAEAAARLDEASAHDNAALPRLAEFILPAGTRSAALVLALSPCTALPLPRHRIDVGLTQG